MDILWIDQEPSGKPMTDAEAMSATSNRVELEEVYFLCTFWDAVGTHYL